MLRDAGDSVPYFISDFSNLNSHRFFFGFFFALHINRHIFEL
jgi:hypothetical protein